MCLSVPCACGSTHRHRWEFQFLDKVPRPPAPDLISRPRMAQLGVELPDATNFSTRGNI